MYVRELRDLDELREWTPVWERLARESGALYFATPGWVAAWATVLEPDAKLTLLIDGSPDDPDGLLPVSWLRRRLHPRVPVPIPYLGIAGSGVGAADHLGPITTSPKSAEALLATADELSGRLPLVLANLAPVHHAAAERLPHATRLAPKRCPVVDLRGIASPDDLWSAKLRKNIRRRRRLMAEAGLTARWIRLEPGGPSALMDLQRLHVARWRSRGGEGLFDERRVRFLEALAGSDGEDGVWLQLIESADGPVAALLGFQFGRTFCTYKTGWDPTQRELGLGILLHSAAIERAIDLGFDRYDFLRGTEGHKYTLGGVDELDATYIVPSGPLGRLLIARDELADRRAAPAPRGEPLPEVDAGSVAAAEAGPTAAAATAVRRGLVGGRGLAIAAVNSGGRRLHRHRLLVLAYHGVDDAESFDRHLAALGRHHDIVSLDDVRANVLDGAPLPERSALITFDDGHRSVLEAGLPRLEARGLPAALFVVSDLIGTDAPFWWDEVEQLVDAGRPGTGAGITEVRRLKTVPNAERLRRIDELRSAAAEQVVCPQLSADDLLRLEAGRVTIGSHTATHPCLDRCTSEEAAAELDRSRRRLEEYLGREVDALAYPNGNVDDRVRSLAGAAGYRVAFAFDHLIGPSPAADPLLISRVRVDSTTNDARFDLVTSGVHPALHRLRGRT